MRHDGGTKKELSNRKDGIFKSIKNPKYNLYMENTNTQSTTSPRKFKHITDVDRQMKIAKLNTIHCGVQRVEAWVMEVGHIRKKTV